MATVGSLLRWVGTAARPTSVETLNDHAFSPEEFCPALKTRLLILQPTPFCNIDCDYCYLPNRASTARMGLDTIHTAAHRLLDDDLVGPTLTVVWHAGEPLVLPPSYYDEAIHALSDVLGDRCCVSHSIQTNATLIDEAWCRLFKQHGVRVGVSVDGPASLHDAHRKTRSGAGTHARVLRGMDCLREHGVDFHAIAVVTPDTFAQADAFLDFFEAQGVREVGCNFDEAEGIHPTSSLAGHEEAHLAFLTKLLERTQRAESELHIRELAVARRLIAEPRHPFRWNDRVWPDNSQVLPFALVTVGHDGAFSTFSPELLGQSSVEYGDFSFGNVHDIGYFASAQGERFSRVWDGIIHGVLHCERTCAHFGFCGGGSPVNKLYENGRFASGETLYCRTMVKRPFDAVLAWMESRGGLTRTDHESKA